jgi:large subunit ribosomal protein L17
LGARVGDNAETAMIELVDFNEIYGKGKGEVKDTAKKTRRGGGRKKGTETGNAEQKTQTVTATETAPAKDKKAEE